MRCSLRCDALYCFLPTSFGAEFLSGRILSQSDGICMFLNRYLRIHPWFKEASEMGMFGSLRLTVVIDSEGMIRKLNINKSSGHKELDEAAMNIVKLGEPYARFPAKILKEVDLISITRKWKFTEQDNFYSQ